MNILELVLMTLVPLREKQYFKISDTCSISISKTSSKKASSTKAVSCEQNMQTMKLWPLVIKIMAITE